jgi:MFS transporter, DHA1 family, inner membrane transport protein
MGLLGIFLYFTAQGGVWAYLERMGVLGHLSSMEVATALAVSSIAGMAGAGFASWIALRFGRVVPLGIATACTVLSLFALIGESTFAVFVAMCGLFNFAWNAAVPYQMGILSEIDSSRRTVALASAVLFAGLSAGPIAAAAVVGNGHIIYINWLGAALSIASFLLFRHVILTSSPKHESIATPSAR